MEGERSKVRAKDRPKILQKHAVTGRALLLTFDAFSTLFHPRRPVSELYASVGRSFGLPESKLTSTRLESAFRTAFKAQSKAHPNYGRDEVLRGQYGGPRQWWSDLLKDTFSAVLNENTDLPNGMIEKLLEVFASKEGYALYDDVEPFFRGLQSFKAANNVFDYIVTGVISNSDDRVPAVLKSLGLSIGNTRADRDRSSMELPGFEQSDTNAKHPYSAENDIDMVVTSYEAGQEKPHRLIYDIAARQAKHFLAAATTSDNDFTWTRIHTGDDLQKDCIGAKDAEWTSFLLTRDVQNEKRDARLSVIVSQSIGTLC
ncbi:hypothetical protein BGW36DRAFT_393627 [Talaromyces proteolyticus]|uniref:Haloacid dehalogenase-like hydrolase n=1 Tax=Talaromyces proteolyticus TaxID=1131652 RepID=A0AAD4Q4P2_9EURO|nr:uncharacterized protein BGW36DRAFT_393627 [Talaromyces proteolyticus]KAH8703220.1 hypothetical protein BGW36DRAFT_393627 [Talaromyces proteolyticus]